MRSTASGKVLPISDVGEHETFSNLEIEELSLSGSTHAMQMHIGLPEAPSTESSDSLGPNQPLPKLVSTSDFLLSSKFRFPVRKGAIKGTLSAPIGPANLSQLSKVSLRHTLQGPPPAQHTVPEISELYKVCSKFDPHMGTSFDSNHAFCAQGNQSGPPPCPPLPCVLKRALVFQNVIIPFDLRMWLFLRN